MRKIYGRSIKRRRIGIRGESVMALTVADFLLWCVRGKYSEHFFGDGCGVGWNVGRKIWFYKKTKIINIRRYGMIP